MKYEFHPEAEQELYEAAGGTNRKYRSLVPASPMKSNA